MEVSATPHTIAGTARRRRPWTRPSRDARPLAMATPGKLEITIKINALPTEVRTDANGWKAFAVDCEGVAVSVRVRPKMWTKLEQAAATFPLWVAAIAGKMGKRTAEG